MVRPGRKVGPFYLDHQPDRSSYIHEARRVLAEIEERMAALATGDAPWLF
jgi:hypothetical protein